MIVSLNPRTSNAVTSIPSLKKEDKISLTDTPTTKTADHEVAVAMASTKDTIKINKAEEPNNSQESPPYPPTDATSPSPNNTQPSRLLALPTEIRLRIFDLLMQPDLPICLLISDSVHLWGQGLPKDIHSLSRVCKAIDAEVMDTIWERLRFRLRADNGRGLPSSVFVGKTEASRLLSRIRHAEVCFPMVAIQGPFLGNVEEAVGRRLKGLCEALEGNVRLRTLKFNCDTTAFVGEHDDKGIELMARTFSDLMVKLKARGVKVELIHPPGSLRKKDRICVKVVREDGFRMEPAVR